MSRRTPCLLSTALLCLLPAAVAAQAGKMTARDRLIAAHAQYYTPTASGLRSFHCGASVDWKALLLRSGTEVQDTDPGLRYLQAVQLGVSDDLRTGGSLEWTEAGAPPAASADGVKMAREGFEQAVAGFFQTWNGFVNGTMLPIPDRETTVTESGEGVHVSATGGEMKIDEDYDRNMLLTGVVVVTPALRVQATPTYALTRDGLVISSIRSQTSRPPSAAATEATFLVDYARVDGFQIPSRVVLDVQSAGVIELTLSNCRTTTMDGDGVRR